jgi:hypothetical protein
LPIERPERSFHPSFHHSAIFSPAKLGRTSIRANTLAGPTHALPLYTTRGTHVKNINVFGEGGGGGMCGLEYEYINNILQFIYYHNMPVKTSGIESFSRRTEIYI